MSSARCLASAATRILAVNCSMFNDNELATLRNRFKRDAEFLMKGATSSEEDEKSKIKKHDVGCR